MPYPAHVGPNRTTCRSTLPDGVEGASPLRLLVPLSLIASLAVVACGGADDEPATSAGEADSPAGTEAPAPSPQAEPAARGGEPAGPVPVVRFAAHGPAPNTVGPRCGEGIIESTSSLFRVTAPEEWVHRGGSGGSGATSLGFDARGTRVEVDLYGTTEELERATGFEDLGETGVIVDLAGTPMPLHRVTVEDRTGFGILGFVYIEGLPTVGEKVGSVLVTSRVEDAVTPEEAAQVLRTVRLERCSAISQILIWGPVGGYQLVPEFEGGDPLGKVRPDQDPPAYVPGESVIRALSEEQVAYLLPLEPNVSACVAPLVRADADGSDPLLHLKVLTPMGTHREVLAEYVSRCGG